jgi:phosphosulfolactate synthase
MNFTIKDLPKRTVKPREGGITMVMDKGLSLQEAQNMLEVGEPYIDLVKLGFGTSYVTPNLDKKIALYQEAGMGVYLGGTLLEAFIVRGQFDDFLTIMDKYNLNHVEVSDGSIELPHDEKCEIIAKLSKHATVLSEVGSKDENKELAPYKWIELMQKEIDAGAYKVIAEARESGTVGIYRDHGEVREGLIDEILTQIPQDKIIWEAPQKSQQVWFIKLLGSNVNLGNIRPDEVIALETLRIGLRGDTFHHFLKQ